MRNKLSTAKRHSKYNRRRRTVAVAIDRRAPGSPSIDRAVAETLANFVFDSLEVRQLLAAHIVGSNVSYTTIQSAVDAAKAGATITVDAGTYGEQVYIDKSLSVLGAKAGVDARTRSTSGESILTGIAANGSQTGSFMITASDVTIDGFTVQGTTNKSTTRGAGIVIYPGLSGTHVFNNIVQNNVAGLFLANASSSDAAMIQRNLFQNNNNAGANGGRGIYTDGDVAGGKLTNVTIDNNTFINNRGGSGTTGLEAAVAIEAQTAGNQTNIRVTNNTFTNNGKSVLFFNTTGLLLQGNTASGALDWYSGSFRFEGNNHDVTISYNNIINNTGPGVAVDANGVAGDNSGFVVTRNNIYGNGTTSGGKLGVMFNQSVYDGTPDVTNNYWGNSSGPSGDGPGTGDSVYGNAYKTGQWNYAKGGTEAFSPWATSAIDITKIGVPTAPTGLSAKPSSATQVQLAWTVTSNLATAQLVQRSTDGVNFVTVATVGGTATAYADTGLSGGVTYTYRIVATSSNGNSPASNTATAKTPVYQSPVAPTGLSITGTTGTSVSLAWNTPSYAVGIAGYVVYRNGVAVGTATGTSFTDTGLVANTTYTYAVATKDTTGTISSQSGSIAASTAAAAAWSPVSIGSSYNRPGIIANGTRFTGGFDGGGYAYSSTLLGTSLTWNGSTFQIGAAGTNDVVNATGQTIALTQTKGTTLAILAAAVSGNQANQSFVVRYTDGTTQTVTLSLSDWATPQNYTGEAKALSMSYRNASGGTQQSTPVYVYGYTIALNASKTLSGITLPNNAKVNVLAINVLTNSAGAPAAPANLTASAGSTSQIRLNWSTNSGATGFTLQRSIDGVNFTTVSSVIAATATTYTDSGLSAGTKYYYRLYATNAAGTSPASAVTSATTVSANAVITPLSSLSWTSATSGYGTTQKNATIIGNVISLRGTTYASGIGTHADSTITYDLNGQYTQFLSDIGVDDEVTGKGTGSVDFQVVADGKILFDSGVLTNQSGVVSVSVDLTGVKTLKLVASSVNGDIDFAHADWANARLLGAAQPPAAPASVAATGQTSTSIQVNWSASTGSVTGYRVERSLDGTTWSALATVAANVLTYVDNGLTTGNTYRYRIVATSTAGDSAASAVATAKPIAATAVTTQLSSLNWTSATSGYGTVQKNLNASGDPIAVNGKSYASGVGTHADSTIVYDLAGKYSTFQTDIGYDDRTAGKPSDPVYFQVVADGKVIYDSGTMTNTSATRSLSLDITGVKTLTLIVKAVVAGNIDYCHVDWAGAQLIA